MRCFPHGRIDRELFQRGRPPSQPLTPPCRPPPPAHPHAQEGLHYTVDCGKDLFTATTQNWGKTRMVSLEELGRPDRCAPRLGLQAKEREAERK